MVSGNFTEMTPFLRYTSFKNIYSEGSSFQVVNVFETDKTLGLKELLLPQSMKTNTCA
jgi:hypothetical protein